MNTLPLNWAVEIPSQQDVERLQELFPDAKSHSGDTLVGMQWRFSDEEEPCMAYHVNRETWGAGSKVWYKSNGYTIYTITELETILNER